MIGVESIVIIGKKYNWLIPLEKGGKINAANSSFYYLCICNCGNKVYVKGSSLVSLRRKSCGCKKGGNKTHNMSSSRIYSIWTCMKRRCYDKKHKSYKRYGAKGISVCSEWVKSFDVFHKWAIENGYSEKLSLDRFPNKKGNYEPANCRWATNKEQSNNMSNNRPLTYKGETRNVSEWATLLNIPYTTIHSRLGRGYSIEKTFEMPIMRLSEIEINGVSKTVAEWGKMYDISARLIRNRLRNGWEPHKAITYPNQYHAMRKNFGVNSDYFNKQQSLFD